MQVTRRQAREWAIQMLTAADLNPVDDIDVFIAGFWAQRDTLDEEDGGESGRIGGKMRTFAEDRVRGVLSELAAIDAKLTPLLDGWDLPRLGTIERAVLRMGAWEIDRCSDIPAAVVINEAIDLVNWFSSPRSRTLVNGVLDRYAKGRDRVEG